MERNAAKYDILCLHGRQQTSEVFRARLGRLPKKLASIANLVFVDAPFELPLRPGDQVNTRTWWFHDARPDARERSFTKSMNFLEKVWKSGEEPDICRPRNFIGVIGFSMGASMACAIAAQHDRFPGLKFILAASAAKTSFIFGNSEERSIQISSLHIFGTKDNVVPAGESESMATMFKEPLLKSHDQGHSIPTRASELNFYVEFIKGQITLIEEQIGFFKINSICASDEIAQEQRDEIESIQAIYPEIKILVPAPNRADDSCACFSIDLKDLESDPRLDLSLTFEFTSNYPLHGAPNIRVKHDFNALSFPPKQQAALLEHLKTESLKLVGTQSAFSLINIAVEWLSDESNSASLKEEASTIHAGNVEETHEKDSCPALIEVEEAEELDMIRKATLEACEEFKSRVNDSQSIAGEAESGGGVRRFVVGLIGKPSAGKSTFFNCITRLQNEAKVGAHPFTTIEPNFGVGWWASNDKLDCELDPNLFYYKTRYGRTENGRRLLPLVVKDVAGLIPGAYKGHGKGNRFLNDLCDADVLIHIVDVSGESNKQGVQVARGDPNASRTEEDVEWVRQELHQWIFGNIREKWSSVVRAAKHSDTAAEKRVLELFSGYKGSKSHVKAAAHRAKIDLHSSALLDRFQLHRLVAHFLTVRFPMLLALNKCDKLLSEPDHGKSKIQITKEWALERGYIAVACSARIESELLNHSKNGVAKYELGSTSFQVLRKPVTNSNLILKEASLYFGQYGSTGVLDAISNAVSLIRPQLVYPLVQTADLRLDCLQCLPGSTIEHIYLALKKGFLEYLSLSGDFVRAEAMAIGEKTMKQCGKHMVLSKDTCCVRILTNRKTVWQQQVASKDGNKHPT